MRQAKKILIADVRDLEGWQVERVDVGRYRFAASALDCFRAELRAVVAGGVVVNVLQSFRGGVYIFDVRSTDASGNALELAPDTVFQLWGEQPPALPVTEEI